MAGIKDTPTTVGAFLASLLAGVLITTALNHADRVLVHKVVDFKSGPMFFAPSLTLATAGCLLWPYIFPSDEDVAVKRSMKIWSAGCLFFTFLMCEILMLSDGWNLHLGSVFLLFSIYIIWDYILFKNLPETDFRRNEIRNGSFFINIPTVVISLLSYLYLILVRCISIKPPFDPETYVSGLITFHLGVASISYLIVSNQPHFQKSIKKIVYAITFGKVTI